jgi:chromosomal replication initiation ATPase DnaA
MLPSSVIRRPSFFMLISVLRHLISGFPLRLAPCTDSVFIATQKGIGPELICSGSRKPFISDARSIVAYLAVEETGHAATEVARHLGISQTSVLQSVKKGKILYAGIEDKGRNWRN